MSEEPNLDNTVITSDSQFIALTKSKVVEMAELRGCSCLLENTATTSTFLVTFYTQSLMQKEYSMTAFAF